MRPWFRAAAVVLIISGLAAATVGARPQAPATPSPALAPDLARDLAAADEFRERWLQQIDPDGRALPQTPDRWMKFAYSISYVLQQTIATPTVTQHRPVATTVRSGVQLALMLAFGFGGSFAAPVGPRTVYREEAAAKLAQQRLGALESAVREYLGPGQADAFRDAPTPQVKVNLAADAVVKMVAEQKAQYPNALLLNLASPPMTDAALEIIAKAEGRGATYDAYSRERNPRLRSAYIADAFTALLMQVVAAVRTGGSALEAVIVRQGEHYDRERRNAEHVVLENLGKDALSSYRALKQQPAKTALFEQAFAIQALGNMSATFATLTPENLRLH